MSVLRERTSQSLGHNNFEDIGESTLLTIMKEELLDISEVELFDATKRWASRQCILREIEVTGSNMRQVTILILLNTFYTNATWITFKILFTGAQHNDWTDPLLISMTPDEFASSPALSGILTESECLAILMNMSSRDKWPMPSQLSMSRQQRRLDSRGSGNPVQR